MKFNLIKFAILFFTASNFLLYSDTIKLQNGDLIEGKILSISDKEISIQIEYGKIQYPASEIIEINYDQLKTADSLFSKSKYEEALKAYQASANLNLFKDFQAQLNFKIGLCFKKLNNKTEAEIIFKNISNQFPESSYAIKSMYELAEENVKDQSVQRYIAIIDKYPDHPMSFKAYETLGDYSMNINDYDRASNYYQILIKKFSKIKNLQQIRLKLDSLNFEKKIPKKLDTIRTEITRIEKMKWHYKNIRQYDSIVKNLNLIINQSNSPTLLREALNLLIKCYWNQAEYTKAEDTSIRFLKIILKNNQSNDKIINYLIQKRNWFDKYNQNKLAIYFFSKLIHENLAVDICLVNLVEIYCKINKFDEAINICEYYNNFFLNENYYSQMKFKIALILLNNKENSLKKYIQVKKILEKISNNYINKKDVQQYFNIVNEKINILANNENS